MSHTEKEQIKKYILRKIALDDADVIPETVDNFELSVISVENYFQEFLEKNMIAEDENKKCGYQLVEHMHREIVDLTDASWEEDRLFQAYIYKHLQEHCSEPALRIWQYTCAEMLNNAIEHSRGEKLHINVYTNCFYSTVVIVDDGVGAFRTLLEYMSNHGWRNPCIEDAILELHKGKLTSNNVCHSGEGIFFSSKMMDEFAIWSDASAFVSGNSVDSKIIKSHLLAYASRIQKIGTMVCMRLDNETERKIAEVFNMYTDSGAGFVKTRIPIKEICVSGGPVARSQARRVYNRLDDFKEVILDFDDVEYMGQGFADELFRVFAVAHPQVVLVPINMHPDVERMIYHVSRGNVPENIKGLSSLR